MNHELTKKFDAINRDLDKVEHYEPLCRRKDYPDVVCGCEIAHIQNNLRAFISEHFIEKEEMSDKLSEDSEKPFSDRVYKMLGQEIQDNKERTSEQKSLYTKAELLDMVGKDKDVSDTNRVYIQNDYGYNKAKAEIRERINANNKDPV